MTTGIMGLCLRLKELDVRRSKQWGQGCSDNEVSSGRGRDTVMSLFTVRRSLVTVQL